MTAVLFYDVVVWLHILAVLAGFGVVFTYPVWYALVRGWDLPQRVMFHRAQATFGKFVITPGLVVLVLTGAYLAGDRDYWSESWVTIPLLIAIAIGGLGGFYFGPQVDKLAEMAEAGGGPEYDRMFGQLRNVGYFALFLVVVAAFLMVVKPGS